MRARTEKNREWGYKITNLKNIQKVKYADIRESSYPPTTTTTQRLESFTHTSFPSFITVTVSQLWTVSSGKEGGSGNVFPFYY